MSGNLHKSTQHPSQKQHQNAIRNASDEIHTCFNSTRQVRVPPSPFAARLSPHDSAEGKWIQDGSENLARKFLFVFAISRPLPVYTIPKEGSKPVTEIMPPTGKTHVSNRRHQPLRPALPTVVLRARVELSLCGRHGERNRRQRRRSHEFAFCSSSFLDE